MEVEKEVRYEVSNDIWNNVLNGTTEYKPKEKMTDITMGKYGLNSFQQTGLVFRVRQKGEKISLEIKKKVNDNEWLEEGIALDSMEQGISYLHLAGLEPYLFINRFREVRKYKGLKIFFDDVELLGKFIEIEYQESNEAVKEINEFIDKFNITGEPAELYGTIIIKKYNDDMEFKQIFDAKMKELIK